MRHVCIVKSRRFPLRIDDADDGGTVNAWKVVEALRLRGIHVEVFTRVREPALGETSVHAQLDVPVHYVGYEPATGVDGMERDFREGLSFCQRLAVTPAFRRQADDPETVVHVHHWTSSLGLAVTLPGSARVVYTPHLLAHRKAELLRTPLSDTVRSAEETILRRADRIIALSRSERDDIASLYGVPSDRIDVIPNGVDTCAPAGVVGAPLDTFRLLTVGRLARQKGIDDCVRALAWLRRRGAEATLDVVGAGYAEPSYEAYLRRVIDMHRMEPYMRFAGAVDRVGIRSLFGKYDFLLHLSRYESQGIAVLEAMAAGMVVVASDLPAIGEYLDSWRNGVLVPRGDYATAGQAVINLAASPEQRNSISAAARATGAAYTWTACTAATLDVLQ